jgi:hypothetical protein
MAFIHKPPRYHTLLLTMWEERNRDPDLQAVWRFRLEDPSTDQRQGFASLEALVAALEQKVIEHKNKEFNDEK